MLKIFVATIALAGSAAAVAEPVQWTGAGSNGHYYEFVGGSASLNAQNLQDAIDLSAARGGYLATVTSQGENDFLNALDSRTGFIGGSVRGEEGTWRWLVGPEAGLSFYSAAGGATDLSYSFWSGGEPNNFGDEDAVLANWTGGGAWNDIVVSNSYGFFVEYDQLDAVPEPATWGMMLLGFGLVGAATRRRRLAATA